MATKPPTRLGLFGSNGSNGFPLPFSDIFLVASGHGRLLVAGRWHCNVKRHVKHRLRIPAATSMGIVNRTHFSGAAVQGFKPYVLLFSEDITFHSPEI